MKFIVAWCRRLSSLGVEVGEALDDSVFNRDAALGRGPVTRASDDSPSPSLVRPSGTLAHNMTSQTSRVPDGGANQPSPCQLPMPTPHHDHRIITDCSLMSLACCPSCSLRLRLHICSPVHNYLCTVPYLIIIALCLTLPPTNMYTQSLLSQHAARLLAQCFHTQAMTADANKASCRLLWLRDCVPARLEANPGFARFGWEAVQPVPHS